MNHSIDTRSSDPGMAGEDQASVTNTSTVPAELSTVPGELSTVAGQTARDAGHVPPVRAVTVAPTLYRNRAVVGLLSCAWGLAAGELSAALFTARSPVVSVGDRVIDAAPKWLKEFAISTFGTNDKQALLAGILALTASYAVAMGFVARRSRAWGIGMIVIFGGIGVFCASSGRSSAAKDVVPVLIAMIAAIALMLVLRRAKQVSAAVSPGDVAVFIRRRSFVSGAALASAGAVAYVGRRKTRNAAAIASRRAAVIPTAAENSVAIVPAAGVDVIGAEPFFTPNERFYRIDTAIIVPQIDATKWSMTISGRVDKPITLTFDDLLKRKQVEHDCTLMCVSNEVGGNLIGNARWQGVRLADILREVGVQPEANQVFARSVDGFTAGFPLKVALDGREALIATAMNGEPLPFRNGFPARLVIPGIYGYVSAVKWLKDIKLTTFEEDQGYWIPRGWSALGPIKTGSRIDVPSRDGGDRIPPGPTAIAGIAWAQQRGIGRVEVQIDDLPWRDADLAADGGIDTWRQWKLVWNAKVGVHQIRVRATDGTGETQTETVAPVDPDGATGWHTITVKVV